MRKLKVFMVACALMGSAVTSWAQMTDVTNTYIQNANLKDVAANSTTNGTLWPVYTTGRTGYTQHPNYWYLHTNGTTNHNGGGEFFECWAANSGVKRWTLFQDITLPAGKYQLTGQYSTNENRGVIKTVAITPHHSYFSPGIRTGNWGSWGSETAEFTIYETTSVRIGMIATNFAQNHGFTLLTSGARQLLKDEIDAAPSALTSEVATATTVYDNTSLSDSEYANAAKTLHDAVVNYRMENATAESPVDLTDKILNPSFEGVGSASSYTGANHAVTEWTYCSSTHKGTYSATNNDHLITDDSNDAFYYANLYGGVSDFYIKQTITGLKSGRYRLTALYTSTAGNQATLYIGDKANGTVMTATSTFAENSTIYDLEEDGDIEIGISSTTWFKADNFRLYYLGDPLAAARTEWQEAHDAAVEARDNATYSIITGLERTNLLNAIALTPSSIPEYESATTSLNDATAAFTGAVADYNLLNTEKSKATDLGMNSTAISDATPNTLTGLGATQSLKVAEYDYVTTEYQYGVELGEWKSTATNTKAANFNNEHWSGTTHNYKNQDDSNGQGWNASSWSINFNQNVTLPAGKYVFKVAGRQASDEHITTSLVVKNGETELGRVSDFPRSNAARGINKSGRTSFNENNDQYANNGKGYGWEWRYVKFELAEDATVNIAINAVATASHCWVSFGDYTLQTDEEANIALIAYNVALNNARTVLNDATYANVQGTDRSNLQAAINADGTLDKSNKTDIETATTNLNTAADAFISGLASWNAYVMVKGYADLINASALPYASEEKITAVTTAKNATVNTADDADTQTAAINTANRAAYESNALAEGVATAVNVTNIIQNADGSATTGWSESFWTASNEAYTEANGNATNTYFDKNGVNSFETSQTIHLLKGNYILSVTARAQANINSFKMQATNNAGETEEINLTAMGNTNGVFNRGWNDFTLAFEQEADGDATITIVADNTTNDANFWMSWDRFRLVSLDAINEPVEVTSAGFATYVSDYNLDYSGVTGLKAYKATVAGNTITFSPVTTVPAGEGVLLRGAGDTYNVPVTAGVAAWNAEDNAFIRGTGDAVETGSDPYNYILNNVNGVIGFYRAAGQTVATNRAYLQTTTNAARLNISFDDDDQTTGIARVEETVANDAVYTLSGMRVEKPTKGLYIKNGKKVVIK